MDATQVADALGAMAAIAVLVVGVGAIGAAVHRPTRRAIVDLAGQHGRISGWLVAAIATAGSLWFSEVAGFPPCALCWYQRIAMYPLVVVLGIRALRPGGSWDLRIAGLALVAIGLAVNVWHVVIETVPSLDSGACAANVPCTVRWVEGLGFFTIPRLATVAFVLVGLALALDPTDRRRGGEATAPLRSLSELPTRRNACMSPNAPSDRAGTTRRSYTPFIVLAVILVIGIGVALLAGGDDGDEGVGTDAAQDGPAGDLATAEVTVGGEPLAPIPEGGADPAVGSPAPTLEGLSPAGEPTTVSYGDGPTLLAFLAHWCPHCQAELPELVQLAEEGGLDGIDTVAVLTGTDEAAPNFPPGAWLEREGWTGRTVLDDEGSPAATGFGLTSYPYLVLVDEDGNIVDRNAGALGLEGLRDFVAQVG